MPGETLTGRVTRSSLPSRRPTQTRSLSLPSVVGMIQGKSLTFLGFDRLPSIGLIHK